MLADALKEIVVHSLYAESIHVFFLFSNDISWKVNYLMLWQIVCSRAVFLFTYWLQFL